MSQGGTTQELNAANHDQENAEEQVPQEPVVDDDWERPAADEAQGQQNVGASSGWRSRRRQAGPGTEEEDPSLSDPWESGNQDQWDNFEKFMRYRERNGRYENSGKGKGKGGRFRGEDDLDDRHMLDQLQHGMALRVSKITWSGRRSRCPLRERLLRHEGRYF